MPGTETFTKYPKTRVNRVDKKRRWQTRTNRLKFALFLIKTIFADVGGTGATPVLISPVSSSFKRNSESLLLELMTGLPTYAQIASERLSRFGSFVWQNLWSGGGSSIQGDETTLTTVALQWSNGDFRVRKWLGGDVPSFFTTKPINQQNTSAHLHTDNVTQSKINTYPTARRMTDNKEGGDFGWVPEQYPDPITDPALCGITDIINTLKDQKKTPLTQLRLCDPDGVLESQYLYLVSSALENFTATFSSYGHESSHQKLVTGPVELGIALVHKINLSSMMKSRPRIGPEDTANQAAQYFSRHLHTIWWTPEEEAETGSSPHDESDANGQNRKRRNGILIFLSLADRVCFISTVADMAPLLPWWRLDHVLANMKYQVRRHEQGKALLGAISDLSRLLSEGEPTLSERFEDFASRFGIFFGFAIFTFVFASWGEYRDKQKRWEYAESRSRLTASEKVKAQELQREYGAKECPICWESFSFSDSDTGEVDFDCAILEINQYTNQTSQGNLPCCGSDGRPIKLLRCGHVFDETCWKHWVNSGNGNLFQCPICRQDIGRKKEKPDPGSAADGVAILAQRVVATTNTALRASARRIPTYNAVSPLTRDHRGMPGDIRDNDQHGNYRHITPDNQPIHDPNGEIEIQFVHENETSTLHLNNEEHFIRLNVNRSRNSYPIDHL